MKEILFFITFLTSTIPNAFGFTISDTTLYVAYEKCSDTTLYNCWFGNENKGWYEKGLIVFDGSLKGLLSSDIYAWYLYYPSDVELDSIMHQQGDRTLMDSTTQLDGSKAGFYLSSQRLDEYFQSMIETRYGNWSAVAINNRRIDKLLQKKRTKKVILQNKLYHFNPINLTSQNNRLSAQRAYYLFEVNCSWFRIDTNSQRICIADSEKRLKKILTTRNIVSYVILDVYSIKPFQLNMKEIHDFSGSVTSL